METVRVEALMVGGDGLATLADGRRLAVRGAFPDDVVRVETLEQRRGMTRAKGWALVEAGKERTEPVCEVATACGGCNWMPLLAEAAGKEKLAVLDRELQGIKGYQDLTERPRLIAAGNALGYRTRLRLQIKDERIGLFGRGSHQLVEPARCHVASDAVHAGLMTLRELARRHKGALAAFDGVEIAAYGATTTFHFSLHPEHAFPPTESEGLLRKLRQKHVVAIGTPGDPEAWPRLQLFGDVYSYAPPGGFTQVNQAVNRALIAAVLEACQGAQSVLDLYAGAGNFSLPLAHAGLRGEAVEAHATSVEAAQRAAQEQALDSISFHTEDVAAALERLRRENRRFDVVLADPPRTGLRQGMETVALLAKRNVLLCSCDVATFARDLTRLTALGFVLDSVQAFDMFPQTHHVEALARLSRAQD